MTFPMVMILATDVVTPPRPSPTPTEAPVPAKRPKRGPKRKKAKAGTK